MAQAVIASERSYAAEVPFHGNQEGASKLYGALVLAFALLDAAMPWLDRRLKSAHGAYFMRAYIIRGIAIDLLCVMAMSTCFALYRNLSRRIALGGSDAGFLDTVRMRICVMTMNLLALGWMLWTAGLFSK